MAQAAAPTVARPPRFAKRTLWAALALGALAEWAFDGHSLGLSVVIFGGATLAALRWVGGIEGWQTGRPVRWLVAAGLLFAAFIALRDSSSMAALNSVALLWCALAAVTTWRGASAVEAWSLGALFGRPLQTGARLVPAGFRVMRSTVKLEGAKGFAVRWAGPMFRSMVLVTPVLALVFGLLMSASTPFFDRVLRVAQSVVNLSIGGPLGSLSWVLIGAVLCAGALSTALARRSLQAPVEGRWPWQLGATEGFSLVTSLTALIATFDAVSLECAFASDRCGLPDALTYAQYVHNGFAELLVVSGVVLLVLIALNRRVALNTPLAERLMRVASSALVLVTLPLVSSAISRLQLYEAAYGFTVARVLAQAVMVFVGGLLAVKALTLWVATERFAFGAVLVGFATLSGLNLLDVEGFVTTQNLEASIHPERVDRAYLATLSADSALASRRYLEAHPTGFISGDTSARCTDRSLQSWSVACARLRQQALRVP